MRIGIISDIHEDVVPLWEAMNLMEKRQCDDVVCLGDILGFRVGKHQHFESRDAHECIELIRQNCSYVLVGNHDLYFLGRIPEYQAGFQYPENWYGMPFHQRKELAEGKVWLYEDRVLSALLRKEDREFLEQLSAYKVIDGNGTCIMLSHYAYPDLYGTRTHFHKESQEIASHFAFMEDHDCRLSVSGHLHAQGVEFFYKDRVDRKHFGIHSLENEAQWITGPCIVRGDEPNGFMVLDTDKKELEVVALGN